MLKYSRSAVGARGSAADDVNGSWGVPEGFFFA